MARSKTKSQKSYVHKKKKPTTKPVIPVKVVDPIPAPIATKNRRPRKPRSKKFSIDRMYFTQDTENAIVKYNNTECMEIRETIYNTQIKYAFEKLVENVFNTFKFSYLETGPLEAQKETVAHLVANMNKFDPAMGFKAYSYFSIVAKNYLIALNNNNYKRFNQHVDIGEERDDHTIQLQSEDKHYKDSETAEFMTLMVQFWENNVNKIFTKSRDLNIANAVIELFRNSDRIDAYNKKALYLYIREISSCKTQQITKVINRMKQYQSSIYRSYIADGTVEV
jgi:hypothetical protein